MISNHCQGDAVRWVWLLQMPLLQGPIAGFTDQVLEPSLGRATVQVTSGNGFGSNFKPWVCQRVCPERTHLATGVGKYARLRPVSSILATPVKEQSNRLARLLMQLPS